MARGLALLTALGAVACGGDTTPVPTEPTETPEPTVTVVTGAPMEAAEPTAATSYAALGYVVALAGSGSRPVVGTTVEASTLIDGELSALEVWGEGPATTGRVHAVVRRPENVLVAAENGLFHTIGDKLVVSPASEELSKLEIQAIYRNVSAAAESLWFVTRDDLYQLKSDKLFRWSIDGVEPAAVTAMLVTDDVIYVAVGSRLLVLDPLVKQAKRVVHDFGAIRALGFNKDGQLQIASQQGLFVQTDENAYTHYTLAEEGAYAAVDGFAVDPKQGTFIVSGTGIYLHKGGKQFDGVASLPESEAPRQVAFDDVGNLWVGDDQSVHAFALGTPVSFAEDVAPILEAHCMSCHADPPTNPDEKAPAANFVDYKVAKEYGASIVLRIASGQMPPPGTEEPVAPSDFALLQRWFDGGLNP